MRISASLIASAVGVTCCLLLGGATGAGHLSDAVLQLVAIPLLLTSLRRLDLATARQKGWLLLFVVAVVLVPMLQLVPLPPRIWTVLPGREPVAATFGLLGRDLPWMPISVSPHATWLSALSVLPAVSVFLATLLLDYRERRILTLVVLAVGTVSVFVGLSQVAQGPNSSLRFFEITNPDEAVGFFANRNHFAALLYTLTLFAAAWLVKTATELGSGPGRQDTSGILALAASVVLLIVLVGAQAMARSRAGLGLTIIALLGAFALAFSERENTSGRTPARLLVGAIVLAVMLAVQYALYRIMDRFAADPLADARIALTRTTIAAAKAFMPFGSGMGTFVPVYAMFEKPQDALMDVFVNRAHNDIVELWLEAGAAAFGFMAIFLFWLTIRCVKLWRDSAPRTLQIDRLLARTATLVVALIVAHSFVDYPLRTGAMMAILALACGLMTEPPAGPGRETLADVPDEQQTPQEPIETPAAAAPQPAAASLRADERWGEGMNWPEEWRRKDARERTPRE